MSYFLGIVNVGFVKKMILYVLIVSVFVQSKQAMAMGKMDFLGELSGGGRDELVKWAGYGEDKLSTVVIGGKLLCHDGGANLVSGATMAVVCGSNMKTKKVAWAGRGRTDSYGEFQIDVPSNLHAIPNLEKICHVKVVHIPSSSPCRKSCTRNHNRKYIKLDSIGEGIRSYTTHNIHLNILPHSHEI